MLHGLEHVPAPSDNNTQICQAQGDLLASRVPLEIASAFVADTSIFSDSVPQSVSRTPDPVHQNASPAEIFCSHIGALLPASRPPCNLDYISMTREDASFQPWPLLLAEHLEGEDPWEVKEDFLATPLPFVGAVM
jgi:hypothetical protein